MNDYKIANDIEAFKDYSGMNDSQLSSELGIPRSTISNWRTGRTSPTKSSLELVYSYLYGKGYRLNLLKEQILKDSQSGNKAVLFHGSKDDLDGPVSLDHSEESNDFGRGFYMGDSFLQSASFVCNYPNSSVYILKLDLTGDAKVVEYNVDTEWMLTIAYFRGKLRDYERSSVLKEILSRTAGADIIKAPIADNRMFQILDEFIDGNITDLQCKSALSATDLGKQFVIVTDRGLKSLEVLEHCYLCKPEKSDYLKAKAEYNHVNSQKVKFVKREYAGKGRYIEEVLT